MNSTGPTVPLHSAADNPKDDGFAQTWHSVVLKAADAKARLKAASMLAQGAVVLIDEVNEQITMLSALDSVTEPPVEL